MSNEQQSIQKIAVVGPESTGKSTMAMYLSKEFNTTCVPEYARYYCQHLNRSYTLQDEVNMFYGQVALEEAIISTEPKIIICDTTILTVKIWCDYLFTQTPKEVTTEITNRKYDFYLLMDIDLAWQDDPLRDFPNEREYFLEIWKKELNELGANYMLISGQGNDRLQHGLDAVKTHLRIK